MLGPQNRTQGRCEHFLHTAHQYLSYPVINTYVQFTVQQFYYFLIFTLRQIFCTKENRRTISSLFPDTPETRRWCAGAGRGKREQYNTFSNRFAFIAPEVQL